MNISKRSFLKGSAALAISGILGAGTSAFADDAAQGQEEKASLLGSVEETWDADYVVVGSGICGLSSAVDAAERGLNVVLLEKNGFLGGTSTVAEMCFGVFTDMQKEAGFTEELGSVASIMKTTQDYHHYKTNALLTRKFYEESADNIAWLKKQGVNFALVMGIGNSYKTAHVYEGLGAATIKTLGARAEELGVQICTNAPGKELVVEDGKVTGVLADVDGKIVRINAKGVLLATGGYSDNAEMMKKYAHVDASITKNAGIAGRDGDGIAMALNIGASEWKSMGAVMFFGAILKNDRFGTHLYSATSSPGFRFNERGVRYADEVIDQINFSHCGNIMAQQKASWGLYSKATLDDFVENGTIFGGGMYTPAGAPLTELYSQIEADMASDDPQVFYCETLDDVAATAGVDADVLKAAVERYDGYCKTGVDEEFLKAPEYLIPVGEGPYYLFNQSLGYFTTSDGLYVNEFNQVLTADGEVIEGLFAGGSDAGGLQGDTYDVGICPGSQQGWGLQSGRVAAKYVAEHM